MTDSKTTDPMEIKWRVLPLLGNPDADVCVGAKTKDNWWIILKDVPKPLAEYITDLHNKELFMRTGWEDAD